MTSKDESCAVALPIERNTATFDTKTATVGATTTQQISLKSLASKVLQRNQERNLSATRQKKDRNFSPENGFQKLRDEAQEETERTKSCDVAFPIERNCATSDDEAIVGPAICRECIRLGLVEILGRMVAGCLYTIPDAEYPNGWRRIPAGAEKCIWN